jgi:hypothetical protein
MTPHPLDGAFQRVRRAREHLGNIERATEDILIKQNEAIISYFKLNEWPTKREAANISINLVVPISFPVLIGEFVYNLRTVLEYLIFELAKIDSGFEQDGTQFPIEGTRKGFKWRIKRGWLNGINAEHIAAIDRLQPYNGCKWTADLQRLSNGDKHREFNKIAVSGKFVVYRTSNLGRPKFGVAVSRTKDLVSGAIVQVNLDFKPSVSFAYGAPLIETLEEIITNVSDTLQAFKPEFK